MAKKFTTVITVNGKEKEISVRLDDSIVKALESVNDENLTQFYIVEEYNAQLSERRETRRHQSLDLSMESGFDVADDYCLEADVMRGLDKQRLRTAIKNLLPSQRELFKASVLWMEKNKRK